MPAATPSSESARGSSPAPATTPEIGRGAGAGTPADDSFVRDRCARRHPRDGRNRNQQRHPADGDPFPPSPPRSTSTATEGADDATFGGMPDADRRLHPDPADATGSFGSPDSTAGGIIAGGVSPEMKGDKYAVGHPASPAADSFSSPHRTQGAPGHVAKVVDWVENEANKPKPVPDRSALSPVRVSVAPRRDDDDDDDDDVSPGDKRRSRSSLTASVAAGFAAATSGALQRMRAARDAPETPVAAPRVRRSLKTATEEEQEEELAMARRMSPLALDDPPSDDEYDRENADERVGVDEATVEVRVVDPYDFDAFVEEEERERAEREMSLARRMSPLSATPPGDSPAIASSPSITPGEPQPEPEHDDKENVGGRAASEERGVTFAATPDELRGSAVENSAYSPEVSRGDDASAAAGAPRSGKKAPTASFAAAVTARQHPNAHGALFASVGSPMGGAPSPRPLRPSNLANIPEGEGGKMSGIIRKSVSNNASAQKRVMTPLPISQSVLERIDALGPEMQPMQKYILLMGIALDFYAKTQLVRELRRFAMQGSSVGWAWFSMVFIFFLLSGSCTTAYWLLHYPMPTKEEVARLGEKQTKVFGFTKLDFKKMVRNAGAVCAMCQLGTAFAAWRALRTNDLRQRKAEMDLRGMQLVDTVFLILPVATLQAYVGMACSSPDIVCPGRTGFDILLFLAVFGAITSATLCFISLDLHEKPPSYTWRQYWAAHKAHLSEMAAKAIFRFLELSARISLIALFSAAKGGWIFFVFFMHAVIVLGALRAWPRIVGGGVPDRHVWEKIVSMREFRVEWRWWPQKLRKLRVPLLDDSKLLAATMIWPPSMFIANATDKHGRFWWRSKSCPRKSFLSLDRTDAIFPLPLFAAVQVFEATLMILIVGAVIPQYPHYHGYFVLTVIVNIAWLMGAIGWMSAAAAWNPFLPEGPPLGFSRGAAGSGAPGTAGKAPRNAAANDRADQNRADAAYHEKPAMAHVAKSMAAPGIFSPGGRTPGRLARGVGAGAARASFPAPAEETPFEIDDGGAAAMSATPTTGRRGAGGGGIGGGGDGRGGDGDGGRARNAAESSDDAAPRALNFTSVPEDFKYDYAAHAAQERAKAGTTRALGQGQGHAHVPVPVPVPSQVMGPPPAHRRTGSGESAGGESASRGGETPWAPGDRSRVAPPSAQSTARSAAQVPSQVPSQARRESGGLFGRAGILVNGSTTSASTTSSAATPPFPGRDATVNAKLTAAPGDVLSPGHRYGGESPGSPLADATNR